ncbi:hypothetical protein SpCBS45565_g07094 [Spizellomyces sp. 'palustris']|nr:hypothetical protein SpCBS45565_g07094 [Spizellomyces sp. 'palustris']
MKSQLLAAAAYAWIASSQILASPISLFHKKWHTIDGKPTQIIGHRGERAFSLPEHSLPAYHMGIWEHADFVEPDLVLTKDGHFVIYHDLSIKSSTDVAEHPEFAHLMKNVTIPDIDGSAGNLTLINDWLIHDLTLAEIKTLRLNVVGGGPDNRNMRKPAFFDGMFTIPTFEEYLDLVHADSAKLGREIGIIPEIKHPAWHNEHYKNQNPHFMEDKLLATLDKYGYPSNGKTRGPIIIQSFEAGAAKYIGTKSKLPVVQLIYGNVDLLTPKGLDEVAKYAAAIGPWKELYTVGAENMYKYEVLAPIPADMQTRIKANGGLIAPQNLSKEIKKRGLKQTPYTFYSSYEKALLNCDRAQGCPPTQERRVELFYFMQLGMDGLFVENVAEAVAIRQQYADLIDPFKTGTTSIVDFKHNSTFARRDEMEWMDILRQELVQTYPERLAAGGRR